ncbi:MAG: cytochrome c [Pseudomonadota bacterium]
MSNSVKPRRPRIRWVLAAVLVVVLVAAWFMMPSGATAFAAGKRVALDAYPATITGVPAAADSNDAVSRGRYLAAAADCEACHTIPGDQPFAGGRPFKTAFGTLYSPNITPDRQTGIGAWSDADFLKALHEGVNRRGEALYPAFPYASFSLLTDADVLAIKAYLFSLPAVPRASRANELQFPFNQRGLMVVWSALYNPKARYQPVAERTASWNRGAYLAEGLAHCGDCHTPRNPLQALNNRRKFAGGEAEGWHAYNLTSDRDSGIGAWNAADLNDYLRTGRSLEHGAAFGPMAEAVHLSLQKLVPADLAAIVEYVRSVPAISNRNLPAPKLARAPDHATDSLAADQRNPGGQALYASLCSGCHTWAGANDYVPHALLTGTRSVNDPAAVNVAQALLHGATPLPSSEGKIAMPSFGGWSDAQIADLSNYVIARFGAAPSSISPAEVRRLRAAN